MKRIGQVGAALDVSGIYVEDDVYDAIMKRAPTRDDPAPELPAPPAIRILARDAQDVMDWPETSDVTAVRIRPQEICIEHTMAGKWPVLDDGIKLEGNPWIIAEIDGVLWAGTYEWLRPGQIRKALGDGGLVGDRLGSHLKQEPLDGWRPQPGERVGFFVSTFSRDSRRTANERSNIEWIEWPEGA